MKRTTNKNINIPINQGHFELDTPERVYSFSQKLANGWEEKYREYRKLWEKAPLNKIILDYPILVDLELSSRCNMKCPMCRTIQKEFRPELGKKDMSFSLAKKIIDEVCNKVYALRLSWVGEPTLNKDLIRIIKYAKDKDIKEVSLLTNGSLLTKEYFIDIQKAGIDWITISIDGCYDKYEYYRKPLKFNDTIKKLKFIYKYKKENKLIKPVIKVQTIWPAIEENPSIYYDEIAPSCDLIAYNSLIKYYDNEDDIVYEDNFSCPMPYQRLTVSASGLVALCSNDDEVECPIGDANIESIHEIWKGEKLNKIREMQNKKNGFKNIPVCARCFFPRKMYVSDTIYIKERKIFIKDYINNRKDICSR